VSISTNSAGVACCGHCGSELEVRCSAGCATPDIQLREDPLAAPDKPPRERSIEKTARGICNVGNCDQPVAPKEHGVGRTPVKCPRHLQLSRDSHARAKERKAAA
jgi:hypothetical protein